MRVLVRCRGRRGNAMFVLLRRLGFGRIGPWLATVLVMLLVPRGWLSIIDALPLHLLSESPSISVFRLRVSSTFDS